MTALPKALPRAEILKVIGKRLMLDVGNCPASPACIYGAGVRCAAPASVIAEKELAWLGEARSKPGVFGVSWVPLATLRPGLCCLEVVWSGFRYRKGRSTY